MRSSQKFYLGVQYWNNPDDYPNESKRKEFRIKVEIEKSQEFRLKGLYAADANNNKRLAKGGETLYLIKAQGITSSNDIKRKVNYSVIPSQDLIQSQYNKNDIIWDYNNINDTRQHNYGEINIHRALWEREMVHTTSVEAGNPDKDEISVDVQFVDGTRSPYEFMLPGASHVVKETFNSIEKNLKHFETVTKKLGIPESIKFEVEPIKLEGKTFNEEHEKSRLYVIREEGKITGGIEAELKKVTLTLPALEVLSKAGIANIGLYALLKFGIKLEGGEDKAKLFNSNEYLKDDKFIQIVASGCVEAGLETELLVVKEQLNFTVKGFSEGCLAGELNYNFTQNNFGGRLLLPPVILGAEVDISSKGLLEFELVKWKKSIEISSEYEIGSF